MIRVHVCASAAFLRFQFAWMRKRKTLGRASGESQKLHRTGQGFQQRNVDASNGEEAGKPSGVQDARKPGRPKTRGRFGIGLTKVSDRGPSSRSSGSGRFASAFPFRRQRNSGIVKANHKRPLQRRVRGGFSPPSQVNGSNPSHSPALQPPVGLVTTVPRNSSQRKRTIFRGNDFNAGFRTAAASQRGG